MSAAFFDTNILVYAMDKGDKRRLAIARELLGNGGAAGVQCLNEFMSVMTRKKRMAFLAAIEARDQLLLLCSPIVPLTLAIHRDGMALVGQYKLSPWDALIVAAALEAGCDTLYSEGMHAGLVVDGRLTIVNPFSDATGA